MVSAQQTALVLRCIRPIVVKEFFACPLQAAVQEAFGLIRRDLANSSALHILG